MNNNENIVQIEKIINDGAGLGRQDGKVIFIPYTIPGETVEFEIITEKKGFTNASLKRIIVESDERKEPDCKFFGICGGCDFQHINYSYHNHIKTEILKELFKKNGDIELGDNINFFASTKYNYRNHIDFSSSRNDFGFRKRNSKHIININHCMLARKEINIIVDELQNIKEYMTQFYIIDFKVSTAGETLLTLYPGKREIDSETIAKIKTLSADNIMLVTKKDISNIKGHHEIKDIYDNIVLIYSQSNFMQTNQQITLKMLNYIRSSIKKGKTLMDLYSGVGLFSLYFADMFRNVISIEGSKSSVYYQRINAKENKINNIKVIQRNISDSLHIVDEDPDVLIVDPPRCGMSALFLKNLLRNKIKTFVYISCDPATLARDAKQIVGSGFTIKSSAIFDMFPQTRHFETVIIFEKCS